MNLVSTLKGKSLMALLTLIICVISYNRANAPICSSPSTTVHGLTSAGGTYPITNSTAVVGGAITITPAYPDNTPNQANGRGYRFSMPGKMFSMRGKILVQQHF